METTELIPMEADFQREIKEKYTKPYRRNMIVLVLSLSVIYGAILMGQIFLRDAGSEMNYTPVIITTIGFILVFFMAYPKFKKMNIHFLEDATFGMIVKERMSVINVFDTPSGINIYWLDSPVIKSFTPDPYRIFREGDEVVVYYLKYSAQYLAYEI